MSPIDTARTIGRPVAYHSSLASHVGGATVAIFLSQLMYWSERTESDLGVYKTSSEWEEETGLTYREQTTARNKLRKLGLLVETEKRLQHRIYYKLNEEAFNEFIEGIHNKQKRSPTNDENAKNSENSGTTKEQSPNDENAIGGRQKRNPTNDENATRYIDRDYQETTTEITCKGKAKKSDPSEQDIDSAFENFWTAGLPKVKKPASAKAFKAKLKESNMEAKEFADMLAKDIRLRLNANQFGFERLHPSTYLNGNRWEDEIIKDKPSNKTACGLRRTFDDVDYTEGTYLREDGTRGF